MTASLARNGWSSLYHDGEGKTVLSGHGHRVRVEIARDWTEINHFDSEVDDYGHMVVLRTGSLAFAGFGNTQKDARQDAIRKARYNGYEPRSPK